MIVTIKKISLFIIIAICSALAIAEDSLLTTNGNNITASPTPPQSTDGPTSCQPDIISATIMNFFIGLDNGPTTPESGCQSFG